MQNGFSCCIRKNVTINIHFSEQTCRLGLEKDAESKAKDYLNWEEMRFHKSLRLKYVLKLEIFSVQELIRKFLWRGFFLGNVFFLFYGLFLFFP